MPEQVSQLTDATFEQHINSSDRPVLVDFWASWCPPCKVVEPILEGMAHELQGIVSIARLNVDQNPVTTDEYQVVGLPTFVLIKGGHVISRRVGAQSEAQLKAMLREASVLND